MSIEDAAKSILDRIMLEEYGGCDPRRDDPCYLKARIKDRVIEVFVVGKWRGIRHINSTLYEPKSKKIIDEVIRTVRINTGSRPVVPGSKELKGGTFEGKTIILKWQKEGTE